MEGIITLIDKPEVVVDAAAQENLAENQPTTETATTLIDDLEKQDDPPAPVVESTVIEGEGEEEYDFNISDAIAAPTGKKKITASSFKEVDEDLYDGDDDLELDERTAAILEKVTARAKEYKEKGNQYKTIAEANEVIKKDKQLQNLKQLHDLADRELVIEERRNKLMKAGRDAETAIAEATTYADKYDDAELAERASDVRIDISAHFNERAKYLHTEIEKTAKTLSLSKNIDPELATNATNYVDKIGTFLGMKIGSKSEADKAAFLKPVKNAIKNGTVLQSLQNDPKLLGEVALFLEYKNKFSEAIASRKTTKTKVYEELSAAPASNGAAQVQRGTPPKGSILKDPAGFK